MHANSAYSIQKLSAALKRIEENVIRHQDDVENNINKVKTKYNISKPRLSRHPKL